MVILFKNINSSLPHSAMNRDPVRDKDST